MIAKVGDHKFRIDDNVASVYSGAVHYWRLDRDKWDDILDKVKGMGFTTITTYIPWEVHEIAKGKFDFGEASPSNDIDAFLTLCEQKGLRAIVRPGPQINSELTWFGYPRRILEDPELQARGPLGSKAVLTQAPRPIPALCYAADKFFEETALWYDAICPILARHKATRERPHGIIAVQVDNEMAYFFHVNSYACDYSAPSIEGYRRFLRGKYGDVEALRAAYGQGHPGFDEAEPPRRFGGDKREDIPYHTDWVEYRERYLVDSLARLADMMRARGLDDVPLFHNYPHPLGPGGSVSGITTPFNLPALEEKLDFVGFDIYSRKELYDHVKTVVSYVVGSSRFPFIPEFIAGVWPWYLRPGGMEDEEFVTKAALMHGIKGFSRYMIVERNRWLASPVRRDGRVRPERYALFKRANEVLKEHRFVALEREAEVLLVANRDYDRLEAASVLVSFPGDFLEPVLGFSEYSNFMTVSEKALGFAEPIQLAKSAWFWGLYRGLTDAGHGFLLGDSALPPERMRRSRYKAVVLSSFEYMSAQLQRRLVDFAKAGGTVVLGPRVPTLDERMRKDETLLGALRAGAGRIVHLTNLPADAAAAAATIEGALQGAGLTRARKNDRRLDVAVHRDPARPDRRIVFVANPSAEAVDAEVELDAGTGAALKAVTEIWDDRPVRAEGRAWRDHVAPYTIKIYQCVL